MSVGVSRRIASPCPISLVPRHRWGTNASQPPDTWLPPQELTRTEIMTSPGLTHALKFSGFLEFRPGGLTRLELIGSPRIRRVDPAEYLAVQGCASVR